MIFSATTVVVRTLDEILVHMDKVVDVNKKTDFLKN